MNPLFQTVATTTAELGAALQTIQAAAPRHVAPGHSLTTCYRTYYNLIGTLRSSVLRKASDTADFFTSNVCREILDHSRSLDQKQGAIDRFVQSLDPKITATRNLIQEMDRLRNGIVSQVTVVQQCRGNTEAISNQFRTIIDALRSVEAFYAQVKDICVQVRSQAASVDNARGLIQRDLRWFAAVSQDYRAFNPAM